MMDARDWFVMILVAGVWIAGTVFIFVFGSKDNAVALLGAWGVICGSFGGFYHWFVLRDSKTKDADNGRDP
jgi:hypothetical protein